jgi:trans-aconitate 2-methyltransferase
MSDWDAARYHRISGPQFDWGQRVIGRLKPLAGERILDLGCGTGRLTRELWTGVGGGRIVGLDASGAMLAVARAAAIDDGAPRVSYVQASGTAVPFREAFDAVFSAATLHWIKDHRAVFASVRQSLKPGGRFVAQCGGSGNLDRLLEHAAVLMSAPAYREYFRDWTDPWYFADPESTTACLSDAGFVDAEVWLEEAPVDLAQDSAYAEFVSCVCIRHHLERLPLPLRDSFTSELTERARHERPPFVLDYRRLNISARTAGT